MHKILIIGPAWVGDMVMAQTLFRLLKQKYLGCQIDVVAPPATAPLLSRMPEITNTWTLAAKHQEFGWHSRYELGMQLRKQKYDQAIVLPNSWKSALIPFIARIPKRTGWIGEQRWILLNDIRRLDKQALPLMIQRFAALAFTAKTDWHRFADEYHFSTLPWPVLTVSDQQRADIFKQFNIETGKPILALCPGAEFGPAKRWPPEFYAEVAEHYLAQGWAVWLFGSPKEQDAADCIMERTHHKCTSFVGKTKLIEAIDLMSASTAVITNDSGLMHIAAALNRPLVVVYGSTSPKFTPPLSDLAKILSLNLSCSPCFQRECPLVHMKCLRDLMPTQVITALDEMREAKIKN